MRNRGHEVVYSENDVAGSDMVLIHSSLVDFKSDIEKARRFRAMGMRVGFTGPFAGAVPSAFADSADFIIKGEPEEALAGIAVSGTVPRGLVESNAVLDLDTLPFPDWSIFPWKHFSYFPALKERPFFPVIASRGCPFTCNYCPYLSAYRSWRQRSVENVMNEIRHLAGRFGMKSFLFRDPVFTMKREWVAEFCGKLLQSGLSLTWACETRTDRLDKELVKTMFDAGLRVINIGVESADIDIIKSASRKPDAITHQEEIIQWCDTLGIRVTAFYLFGMPDDTEESILKTMRYSQVLNTHVAQYFIFTPFPGTEFYDRIKGDITENDWERFDCYTPVFRHKNLSADAILRLKEKAFISYYYRPAWMLRLTRTVWRDLLKT
ncbi:MAG: radical SAM protein [Candidatus Omnitrophica bacterium]|nr:radical SAM protein [Candidatus Omnitrophota bacterium]